MMFRDAYPVLRLLILCLAAAIGYVVVYYPLMLLLFDKRIGPIFFPIAAASIFAAWRLAKLADRYLPRAAESTDSST